MKGLVDHVDIPDSILQGQVYIFHYNPLDVKILSYVNPSSMYSATIEGSLKRGRDGYGGAVKFNTDHYILGNSYRTVWDNRDNAIPFYFTMKGHGEGSARIDIPLAGDSQAVDVPFSFEVPWSLSSDSVPETYTRLVAFGLGQRGQFDFVFGDDTPFSRIVTDIRVFFPESFTVKVASTHHMSEKNAFRYYVELNPSYPFSTDVSLTSACVVPEEYQSLPGHAIQLDSVVTVTGTLHLEKSALKEGWEWPDHLDVSCSLNHQGDVYRTHGAVNLPSEYPLPDISFEYDLRIRPYAFQWGKPNIHLYDTRLRMNFLNKTPFKVRLRGTVASYKDGIILHSVPFGNDIPLEAKISPSKQTGSTAPRPSTAEIHLAKKGSS